MTDKVLAAFLARQREEGMALAAASDLLRLVPVDGTVGQRYLADFGCTGLVRSDGGDIVEADRFVVGIWFPDGYLRHADPSHVLAWLAPHEVFHPNILPPFICVGHLSPGTPLVDLLYRVFEIITYGKVTMREDDALNKAACVWSRRNQDRFPVDRRALKRRSVDFDVDLDLEELRG